MKRVEIEIEHRFKNRFMAKHRINPDSGVQVFGSSRHADIRLLGDNVAGVHASIEYVDGKNWLLYDMGSEHGTWVQKKPIVEQVVTDSLVVNIGHHHIRLVPREINSDLFDDLNGKNVETPNEGELFHQIVIRKAGFVVDVLMLEPAQSHEILYKSELHTIMPPKDANQWHKIDHGDLEIHHRLTRSVLVIETPKETLENFMSGELKWPAIFATVFLLALMLFFYFMPSSPQDQLKEMKLDQNRFTSVIFDAKKLKEKREAAQKQTKQIMGDTPKAANKNATGVPNPNEKKASAAKVINNIKATGLSALIGKISKRAASNAIVIPSQGKSPDEPGSGQALSLGNSTLQGTGKGQPTGNSFKLGGVGTDGKGSGGSVKGIGGLTVGNIGNATVGALEEESEISGGLDRDVIARVIQSNLGQIRYCYERQLSASPDLYGKVKVKFTIGEAGSVISQSIGATSLNNAMVEGCILRRIAGWQFPKPKGGTDVIVTYPFLFKSTQ